MALSKTNDDKVSVIHGNLKIVNNFLVRPSQPPMRTKPKNFFVAKLVEPYCHCDAHLYDPQMTRYKKLADKEKLLHDELRELNQQVIIKLVTLWFFKQFF